MADNRILKVSSASGTKGEVRLFEDLANGVSYASIVAPDTLGSNVLITVPSTSATLATLGLNETFSGNKTFSGTTTFSTMAATTATDYFLTRNGSNSLTQSRMYGTANQVTISTSSGSLTLSLPQDIHTSATPSFAGLTLTGAGTNATSWLGRNASNQLSPITLQGTTNQVNVSAFSSGTVTLSLPQSIHTTATPTFTDISLTNQTGTGNVVRATSPTLSGTIGGSLTFSGNSTFSGTITASSVGSSATSWLGRNASNVLSPVTLQGTTNQVTVGAFSSGVVTLSLPQDIHTSATPTFSTLALTSAGSNATSFLGKNASNVLSPVTLAGTANQVTVSAFSSGTVTLSLPQNINTTSSPTFAGLTLTGSLTGRSMYPAAHDTYTIGLTGNRYSAIYATTSYGTTFSGTTGNITTINATTVNGTNLNATGYLSVGASSAPTMAIKRFSGTLSGSGSTTFAHGLTASKITGIYGQTYASSEYHAIPLYVDASVRCYVYWSGSNIYISTGAFFYSATYIIYVTYES